MPETFFHHGAEKPQGDHVEQDVAQIGVQKLVGEQTPQFPLVKTHILAVGPIQLHQVQAPRRVNIPRNLYLEKEPEEKNDHIEQDQLVHDNGAALVEQALLHRISPIFLLCSHIRPYVNVFRAL